MSQQVRTLLAVGLCFFIIYGWYKWVAPPPVQSPNATTVLTQTAAPTTAHPSGGNADRAPVAPEGGDSVPSDPQKMVPAQRTVVTTDRLSVELSNIGGVPNSWALTKYLVRNDGEHAIDLVTTKGAGPLDVGGDLVQAFLPSQAHYSVEQPDPLHVVYRWAGSGVEVAKTYTFRQGSYLVDLSVTVTNHTQGPLHGSLAVNWGSANAPPQHAGSLSFLRGPPDVWSGIYYIDGKVGRVRVGNGSLDTGAAGRLYWAGVENRYYLGVILPRGEITESHVTLRGGPGQVKGASALTTSLAGSTIAIPPGQTVTETYSIYGGPKALEELKGVGLHLEEAINYGWFGFAAIPILLLLKLIYHLVHNYGVAIILMTLLIKLLLHPVTKASMRSMRKMQALQPRLKELREKYQQDRERLNMETMQLFRAHGVNPMGGCLPMLLQIPVYIALYKVLWNAIELYRAPFFWFYRDLSAPDPYFITPVLLGIAFFLQQRLSPSPSADPAQQKMMSIMPVMFTAFMIFLPSGLVIYILVNTLFSVLQQWLMNRGLGFRDLLRGRLAPRPY